VEVCYSKIAQRTYLRTNGNNKDNVFSLFESVFVYSVSQVCTCTLGKCPMNVVFFECVIDYFTCVFVLKTCGWSLCR